MAASYTAVDEFEPVLCPYNLRLIVRLKRQLLDAVDAVLLDAVLDQDLFRVLVKLWLPFFDVEYSVLRDTLKHLIGCKLTITVLQREAGRLAGNYRTLMETKVAVPPWQNQRFNEWAPVQILESRDHRVKSGNQGLLFSWHVLAGSATGLVFEKFWSNRLCGAVSKSFGFSSSYGSLPMKRSTELVRLRAYVLLCQPPAYAKDRGQELWFERVQVPGSMQTYNRKILKLRARDGYVCPRRFQHACFQCHIGYKECPAAVHPETYEADVCQVCHERAWFDPRRSGLGRCVRCQARIDLNS